MSLPVFSRRQFLATAAAFAVTATGVSLVSRLNPRLMGSEYILVCNGENDDERMNNEGDYKNVSIMATTGSLRAYHVPTGEIIEINIPFLGHVAIQDPRHPHRFAVFKKWGPIGVLADLRDRSIVATADGEDGYVFFGHAAYIRGGSVIACSMDTRANIGSSGGKLTLLDTETLKPVGSMPTHGAAPHQCTLLKDGKTLVVANAGSPLQNLTPNLAWIDAETGRLIKIVDTNIEPGIVFGHVEFSYDGWACICGYYGPPRVTQQTMEARAAVVSPEGKVFRLPLENGIKGEALSIAMLGETGHVAVTVPNDNQVYIFNYRDQTLAGKFYHPKPEGVLPGRGDGADSIIVSSKKIDSIAEVAMGPGDNYASHVIDRGFGGNGSHLARAYI